MRWCPEARQVCGSRVKTSPHHDEEAHCCASTDVLRAGFPPGVVGCTPILRPGDCFQYYSATDLSTPSGKTYEAENTAISLLINSSAPCKCPKCLSN